jgi:hypothetical protein
LATLQELGFKDQVLGSERHLVEKLKTLNDQEIDKIKQAFVKYNHPRFHESLQLPPAFRSKTDLPRANRTLESREACPSDQDMRVPDADKSLPFFGHPKLGLPSARALHSDRVKET